MYDTPWCGTALYTVMLLILRLPLVGLYVLALLLELLLAIQFFLEHLAVDVTALHINVEVALLILLGY